MSIDYKPDNTFIFSFVRMNPPTPGHLMVIKKLINKAVELGSEKVYIITSSSMDGKNPLPCSRETLPKPKTKTDGIVIDQIVTSDLVYKSVILEQMITSYKRELLNTEPVECIDKICEISTENRRMLIENLHVIVLCSYGNPFGFINSIIRRDFIDRGIPKINMFFIVGRDRADFLDTIVDNFKTKDFIKSVDGEILGREGMTELKTSGLGQRNIEDIAPSAYSASFIRGLVKNGKRREFNQVYSKYLPPDYIDKLFETIQIGIQLKTPMSKEQDENPQSRYFDGKLLPIIIKSGGKRLRKTSGKLFIKKRKTRKLDKRISKKGRKNYKYYLSLKKQII